MPLHTLPGADDAALAALDSIRTARPGGTAAPSSEVDGEKHAGKMAKKARKPKTSKSTAAQPADLTEAIRMMAELQEMMKSIAA